jgi:hypothetical protein
MTRQQEVNDHMTPVEPAGIFGNWNSGLPVSEKRTSQDLAAACGRNTLGAMRRALQLSVRVGEVASIAFVLLEGDHVRATQRWGVWL